MGIKLIHGFVHGKQKAKPDWGSIVITETVLIETDSPVNNNLLSLLAALPAGTGIVTANNPKGIAFTFDVSAHPDSGYFILRTAGELLQADGSGCFWTVELNYSNQTYLQLMGGYGGGGGGGSSPKGETNPKQRKDQREVLDPLAKPVVWTRSTSIVQKETYLKAGGASPIIHTNLLPITSPYRYEEVHTTHTFSYNINYGAYTDATYEPYVGKISDGVVWGYAAGKVKFTSLSATEEFQSNGDNVNKIDYHFVRVVMSFEVNPSGWDNDAKLVSMSTLQLKLQPPVGIIPAYYYYGKIPISETEYAQEPWPLLSTGAAVPYDDNDPADYGYVDTGYPVSADLLQITDGLLAGLKNLVIP